MVHLGRHTSRLLFHFPVPPRSIVLRLSSKRRSKGTSQGHGHEMVGLHRRRNLLSVRARGHAIGWEGRGRAVGGVLDHAIPVLGYEGERSEAVERFEEQLLGYLQGTKKNWCELRQFVDPHHAFHSQGDVKCVTSKRSSLISPPGLDLICLLP